MGDPDDVARSVRRYIAGMLGPPWEIDLERVPVADEDRPVGSIETGVAAVRQARISVPQGQVILFMPVTVTLYPSLQAPNLAGQTARRLAHALEQLMVYGADGLNFASGRPAAGPERIPLWDYADVALEGDAAARSGPEFPSSVMWVEDYTSQPIQDTMDPQRWTVILDMRLSWEVAGRAGEPAPPVGSMPQTGIMWDGVIIVGTD